MADYAISNVARRVVYTNTGVGPYSFTFEILQNTDIAVYRASTLLTLTTDYTVTINANGTGSITLVVQGTGNITIVGARAIQRTSDYTTGGDLFASTLNTDLDSQTIYAQQVAETAERGLKAPVVDPTDINMTLPAKASRVGTVLAFNATTGNPEAGPSIASVTTVAAQSANINTVATNIASVNTVAGNNTNINTVAGASTNVTTVATNIASVNTNATNIVAIQNASTNATNAANSATAAQSAQTAAESARDSALAAYDNFDDRYLGSKTSNPTLDNDGNALVAGSLYFNSVDGTMKVYTGSAWVAAYVSGSGFLSSANNLSDVTSTSTARTNLGLTIGTDVLAPNGSGASLTSLNASNISSGTLGVARGGTGAATLTANNVLLGNGTSALQAVAPGTTGNVLTSNGTTWTSAAVSAGFNGATETTSSTTVTLTNTSTQVQAITMTVANKVVQLPNATTLSTEGGPIFVITNKGNITFSVLQTSGANIAIVYPGQTVQCYLINNSTSAGVWTTDKYGNQIAARDFTFSYGSTTSSPMTLPLTTTTGIVFGNVSSILKAKAYSIGADGTVTYGTEVTLLSLSASMPDGCRLTDTTGLIVAAQSSVGSYVVAFSVSGTTITVGTSVQLVTSADGPEYTKLVRLSATTAIVATGKYTPDQTQANFLTISGTSITSNSSTNANVSLYFRGVGIKVKDASVVAFGGIRSATANVALVTFVYSGTSLTASYYNDLSSSFANQNSNTISITSLSTDAVTVAGMRNPANGNAPINYTYSVNTSTGEATLEAGVTDALGNLISNGAFFGVYLGTSGYGITFQGGNLVYATQFNNVSTPRHLVLGPTMFATNMTSLPNILVASDNLFGFAASTSAGPPGLAALYIQ